MAEIKLTLVVACALVDADRRVRSGRPASRSRACGNFPAASRATAHPVQVGAKAAHSCDNRGRNARRDQAVRWRQSRGAGSVQKHYRKVCAFSIFPTNACLIFLPEHRHCR